MAPTSTFGEPTIYSKRRVSLGGVGQLGLFQRRPSFRNILFAMIPGVLAALFFERYRRNAGEREKDRPEAASKKEEGSSATQRDAKDGPSDECNGVVQAKEGAVNAARVAESDERARRGAGMRARKGRSAGA